MDIFFYWDYYDSFSQRTLSDGLHVCEQTSNVVNGLGRLKLIDVVILVYGIRRVMGVWL